MSEPIEITVEQSDASDFLMACLDEWQSMGGDNTEMFEAMADFVDEVRRAAKPTMN